MTKIQPVGPRLLVKFVEKEVEKGSIILTAADTDPHQRGMVISVGTADKSTGAIMVKPGDVVLFPKYSAQEMESDGEKLHLVRYQDVLAIID